MNGRVLDSSAQSVQTDHQEGNRGSGALFAIALFKLIKAALLIALGVGTLSLSHGASVLNTMRHWAGLLGFSPHGQLVNRAVSAALGLDRKRLQELSVGTFVYAVVFLVEGTGLILRKHWAEYMTAIVTASFIPFEVYEMIEKPSATKAVGIAVNAAVVLYLVVRLWSHRRGATGNQHGERVVSA